MIWIVIEMLFPALLIILPMSLYRSNLFFMAKFYLRMAGSESARKLYVQCMLIFLLLYHYVYAGGHFGEWGVLISTIPCAVLFSFRRADRWMHRLHEDMLSSFEKLSSALYHICTPRRSRLPFFFWLPCSIPLAVC